MFKHTFVTSVTHGAVHVGFVVIGLNFLQTQHVGRGVHNFAHDIVEAVFPIERPKVAVGILLSRGINFGQGIVRDDAKAGARGGRFDRHEGAGPWFRGPGQDHVGFDDATHQHFPRFGRIGRRLEFEFVTDVFGAGHVHLFATDFGPIVAQTFRVGGITVPGCAKRRMVVVVIVVVVIVSTG